MKNKLMLAIFLVLTLGLASCDISYRPSKVQAITPSPTSRFTTPLSVSDMNGVESLATGTAFALTAAAGGNPNTNITASPVVGQATTAVSPNTQITFTPTPVVVGAATTAAPVNATPIPYTPLPQGAAPTSWTLHEGEFPYCIARRYNLNPEYLLSYPGNEWTNGAPYFAGQVLIIPPASDSNRGPFPGDRALRPHNPYTVTSSNETMYSIACLFGDVDPAQLAQKNGLSIDATLPVGKVLQIP